jgi:hypothetical protein
MKLLTITIASLLLMGCSAGDGEGLDGNGLPITAETPDPIPEPPTDNNGIQPNLESIQEHVLTPICTQCHAGNNAPLGLAMDDLQTSIENLIDVDSATNPTFKRVLPGDGDNSFLYLKISGAAIAGNQMPLGQTPLDANTQSVIKEWIDSGAPIDNQQLTGAGQTITSANSSATVAMQFSQAIDSQSLNANHIILQSQTQLNNLQVATVELEWLSAQQLLIHISDIPSGIEKLKVSFNQPNISTVISQQGMILDGDIDGQAGGEFQHEISIHQ